jgi:hypothetical protein
VTSDEIDMAEAAILDLLKIGSAVYPQLAAAAPVISMFIRLETHKIKIGLADGTIVSDGHGGLVPITNSRIMPDGSLRPYDPLIDNPKRHT